MSWRRRTELILGLITLSSAFLAAVLLLKADYDVALAMRTPFLWFRALTICILLILLPGLAVAIGTYAHAARDRNWGGVLTILGGLILMWPFVVFYVSGLYVITIEIYALLLAATAALTTIIALFVSANARDV